MSKEAEWKRDVEAMLRSPGWKVFEEQVLGQVLDRARSEADTALEEGNQQVFTRASGMLKGVREVRSALAGFLGSCKAAIENDRRMRTVSKAQELKQNDPYD